jgi:hypothetical protein
MLFAPKRFFSSENIGFRDRLELVVQRRLEDANEKNPSRKLTGVE